jgi:hypothetical protein
VILAIGYIASGRYARGARHRCFAPADRGRARRLLFLQHDQSAGRCLRVLGARSQSLRGWREVPARARLPLTAADDECQVIRQTANRDIEDSSSRCTSVCICPGREEHSRQREQCTDTLARCGALAIMQARQSDGEHRPERRQYADHAEVAVRERIGDGHIRRQVTAANRRDREDVGPRRRVHLTSYGPESHDGRR